MAVKFLDNTGLGYFCGKIKAWCNSTFAAIAHTHTSYAVKHSYTTAANAAKNWYRIANANTSQLDITKPIRAQFIVTAYNTSYAADYYETWFVNAIVFGRQAHIVIFGGSGAPFNQARILYENTVANIDANDRPAIDLYLNYVLPNGTTKIEVEEIYNNGGWTFVADGQLAASTAPSGFESVATSPRNNGINSASFADYVSYLNRQISNITAAFTLADSYLYRSRTLNCTGTFTITIPSINSGYMWCVIKNKNATSGVITLHPSTTSVLIDGRNEDIVLQPEEYVCIHSAGANNYSIIADGRHYQRCIVSVGNKNNFPYHRIASMPVQTGSYITKAITFLVNKDLRDQGYGICRIVFRTENVSSNQTAWVSVQWLVRTSNISVDCIQVGLNNTSGASYADVFYKSGGAYNNCIFRVLTHTFSSSTPACSYTVINSSREVDNTTASDPLTSIESYSSIEVAGTTLHNTNFTSIITASDMGVVRTANSCSGNAATASAVAWSGVTNKPTTIAGYGITDAKIANGTITIGSNSITPLTSHQTLPTLSKTDSGSGNAVTGISVSNHAITVTKGSTFALDNAIIHKTGNEDITGRKIFNTSQYYDSEANGYNLVSRPILRTLDFARGDIPPAEDKYVSLDMVDNTYDVDNPYEGTSRLGGIDYIFRTNGARTLGFTILSPQSGFLRFLVGYDASGVAFASAPSTSSQRDVGTDIVTRDWISNDDRIVHTTGNEQVSGIKSFESSINIRHSTTKGVNPDSTSFKQLNFSDTSGENATTACASCLESSISANGQTSIFLRAYNWVAASSANTAIAVHYPKNGTAFTEAPTPSDVDDNSTKIATTSWAFPRIAKYYTSTQAVSLDLNDFKTPGSYYFQGYDNNYAANLPSGINGLLVVIAPDTFTVKQIFFRYGTLNTNDHYVYVRTYSVADTIWSSWVRLLTDKDTVPVANGGTGQTSVANIQAGKDGDGNTISSTYLPLSGGTMSGIITRNGGLAQSGSTSGSVSIYNGTSASHGGGIWIYGKDNSAHGEVRIQAYNGTYRQLNCLSDGTLKWNGQTVQTSSDERLKTPMSDVPDEVLDAWGAVHWGQFQFLDAVEEKGSSARLHVGLVAQAVDRTFASKDLDGRRYGILCHEVREAEGEVPAVDQWMVRYTEALCMEAAYQRRRADRAEARIKALEDRLEALEAKFG